MFRMSMFVALSLLAVAMTATVALASSITVDGTTTVFSDNFEGAVASTAAPPDTTGDYLPTATIGSYTNAFPHNYTIAVASGTTAGPGAAEGNNYLRVYRSPTYNAIDQNEVFSSTPSSGSTVKWSSMVYIPSGAPDYLTRLNFYAGGNFLNLVYTTGTDVCNRDPITGVDTPTGLKYTPNTWQEWDMSYVAGASTWTLTVGGNSLSGLPLWKSAGIPTSVGVCAGDNGVFYMDAVPAASPEPGTLALLASALIGLLCYAWRKRR